ncbi:MULTISPECIES: alpha-L-fucosidase [Flavobacteriaceae]|uniref:alpha-L-fucosidase n=2 Tax=Flavobacteriaceae TaxID=49546 RepID=A0A4Y8AW12_9FLAO|nr:MULTISPECIES: alpha-L-fucosidase [Flavobacteriaceae]TEW75546.1 alpha-1,3/4-fucosidase [Gramella jeungdoensis]
MNNFFATLICMMVSLATYAQGQRTIKIESGDSHTDIIKKATLVVPTANQYAYKKLEFTCFVHFGVNTFTRKEWGDGFEDPKVFNLQNLDTDQWCKTAKEAGMKLVMFTAKHHDGFVLWQSRYTKHGVMSSPYKDGKGDVLKELATSCEKYGLKLGVYLSPADLYQIENKEGLYGNLSKYTERIIPRPVENRPFANKTTFKFKVDDYNEYVLNQLFELLTEYGPIHEVWFDGAHPKRKGNQQYNYLAWKKLIQTLAPEAVIFGKEDVRWCGNESGATRASEWDVVTFDEDPHQMNLFPDMHGDLGSREKLSKAKYLHYLPAETDTSIREGWFYRDETDQKVRSADDVFDIYERAVGGNATLLLNIPPNREGKFSDEDVRVLKEVGKRIQETYDNDLLKGAEGESAILDANEDSYVLGENGKGSFIITSPKKITLNRFVLQEAIQTHGQRIEKHALDAWVNNKWQQVIESTVVGYKRILRFADVTTNKLRIRILEARSKPSLSKVSAHYYTPRPPQLSINRNLKGQVTIAPKKSDFDWKTHGIDVNESISKNLVIRYTTDGKMPNEKSQIYTDSFFFKSGEVKAKAFENEQTGSLAEREFGLVKKNWTVKGTTDNKNKPENAIDADEKTYWNSGSGAPELTINLKETKTIRGFIYTPPLNFKEGLIEKGIIKVSKNGRSWKTVQTFDLGNLINDPTARTIHFAKKVKGQYIQIVSIRGAGGSSSASIAEIDILE